MKIQSTNNNDKNHHTNDKNNIQYIGKQIYTVDISNFAFNPSELTIKIGDTITWINQDSVQHTITFDSGLDSGILSKGQNYPHTFDKAGAYTYHCKIHPSMKGKVIVK